MSCKIFRDQDGKISRVLAPNGQDSKLYKDLVESAKVDSTSFLKDSYVQEKLAEGKIKDTSPEELALAMWDKSYVEGNPEDNLMFAIGKGRSIDFKLKLVDALNRIEDRYSKESIDFRKEKNLRKELSKRQVPKDQVDALFRFAKENGITKIKTSDLAEFVQETLSFNIDINLSINIDKRYELVDESYDGQEAYHIIEYVGLEAEPYSAYFSKKEAEAALLRLNSKITSKPSDYYKTVSLKDYNKNPDYEYQELTVNVPFETIARNHFADSDKSGSTTIGHIRGYRNKKDNSYVVIEVQSDLFQKNKTNIELAKIPFSSNKIANDPSTLDEYNYTNKEGITYSVVNGYYFKALPGENLYSNQISEEEFKSNTPRNETSLDYENQFLRFLNKDGRWVKFFIQGIVQSAAKAGRNKVYFPSGITAAKVEGHETLENEINKLKNEIKADTIALKGDEFYPEILTDNYYMQRNGFRIGNNESLYLNNNKWFIVNNRTGTRDITEKEVRNLKVENQALVDRFKENLKGVIKRKKEKLSHYQNAGIEQLKPIEAFYENRVKNTLEKLYGNLVSKFKDEHGYTWREVTVTPEMKNTILLNNQTSTDTRELNDDTYDKLVNHLYKLGFSIEGMGNWKKDWEKRNGRAFDASAIEGLVDFTSKMIALQEDASDVVFTEEAAHVIISGYKNTPQYKRAAEEVVNSEEYRLHAERYRELYNGDEAKVREEIIGKILTNNIMNSNSKVGITGRLYRALNYIWNKFKSLFTETSDLKNFINEVMSDLQNDNLPSQTLSDGFLASAKQGDLTAVYKNERQILEQKINEQKTRLSKLRDKPSKKERLRKQIKKLEDAYQETQYELGFLKLLENFKEDFSTIIQSIDKYREGTISFSSKRIDEFRDFIAFYKQDLEDIRDTYRTKQDSRFGSLLYDQSVESLGDLTSIAIPFFEELVRTDTLNFEKDMNLNNEYDPNAYLDEMHHDSGALQFWFGSLRDSSIEIHRMVHKFITDLYNKIYLNVLNRGKELISKVEDLGYLNQNVGFVQETYKGKPTGRFIDRLHYTAYEESFNAQRKALHEKYEYPENYKERQSIKRAQRDAFLEYQISIEDYLSENPSDKLDVARWAREEAVRRGKSVNYVYKFSLFSYIQDKANHTLKERMAIDLYNYNVEMAKWFEKNTVLKDEIKNFKYDNKTGFHAFVAYKKYYLTAEEFEAWAYENTLTRKNGDLLPKGELVEPSDGRSKLGFKNKKFNTVDHRNKDYDKLSPKQKELLNELKRMHKEATDIVGSDPLLLPQITERLMRVVLTKSDLYNKLKLAVKDEFLSAEDDDMYGERYVIERPDGTKRKFVPIYYDKKLEDMDKLTTDTVASIITFYEMAQKFKEFSEASPQMENILYQYGNKKVYVGNEVKIGKETYAYKNLEKFLSMMLYGETQKKLEATVLGKKVNLTKVLTNINGYFRNVNLALNPITAASGAIAGAGFAKVESLVGRYTDKASTKLANSYFRKNVSSAAQEWGQPVRRTEMNMILEYFGVNAPNMQDLDFSRLSRKALDSGLYFQYEMHDFFLKGKIALAVLYKNGLMDKFTAKNGKIEFNISPQEYNRIKNTITFLSNRVDGQLSKTDKAAAHQDAVMQLLTTHRGWLFRGIQDRFKKDGINYMTEEREIGFHRMASRFIFQYIKDVFGSENKLKEMRELSNKFDKLQEHEKKALIRAMYDYAMTFGFAVIAALLNGIADDDDDYTLDLMAYIANRALLETASFTPVMAIMDISDGSLAAGSPMLTEISAVLESPFMLSRQIDTISDFTDFFSMEDVERGAYKGYPKIVKNLIKFTPGVKGLHSVRDPNSANQFLKYKALRWAYN